MCVFPPSLPLTLVSFADMTRAGAVHAAKHHDAMNANKVVQLLIGIGGVFFSYFMYSINQESIYKVLLFLFATWHILPSPLCILAHLASCT